MTRGRMINPRLLIPIRQNLCFPPHRACVAPMQRCGAGIAVLLPVSGVVFRVEYQKAYLKAQYECLNDTAEWTDSILTARPSF